MTPPWVKGRDSVVGLKKLAWNSLWCSGIWAPFSLICGRHKNGGYLREQERPGSILTQDPGMCLSPRVPNSQECFLSVPSPLSSTSVWHKYFA